MAEEFLCSNRIPEEYQHDLKKSVFISRIPKQASNSMLEKLLKACGTLLSWRRSVSDPAKPSTFGIAEFDRLESVFACIKCLNNLNLYDNQLLVKADKNTMQFLEDWEAKKKQEWILKQEKNGVKVDFAELERLE